MDEMVKILNEQGEETGVITEKLKAHKEGLCHGISAVAIINSEGKLLLQKRALVKRDEPGKWDLSAAGHISATDTVKQAAIRETFEEIGIKITEDDLEQIDTYIFKKEGIHKYINHYTYLFIVQKDIDEKTIVLQKSEVDEVKFVTKKEYNRMLKDGEMTGAIKYCKKILDYMKWKKYKIYEISLYIRKFIKETYNKVKGQKFPKQWNIIIYTILNLNAIITFKK